MNHFSNPMHRSLSVLNSVFVGAVMCLLAAPQTLLAGTNYHDCAPTPPMGWNSWDCFGTTVTEEQTMQQTDFMAEKLKTHGW
jgi:alpha-galactosidase